MLTELLKFLKGYVLIRVSGYSPERFLNLCGRHGILLWGLQSSGTEYEMCMSISGFRKIRPLVRKTGTKAVILERHGLPFIVYRYRTRKWFLAGALLAAGMLYGMSLFIWNIHIDGNELLSDETILDYLEEEQVVHGMRKRQVHGAWIEEQLRKQFPEITWVSAEVKGTRLLVHVKENMHPEQKLSSEEPADLAATESGTIVSMIVRQGTPQAEEGMQVEKGQILVSSRVEVMGDDGEVLHAYQVHAEAEIRIQQTQIYDETFSMVYERKVHTGERQSCTYVRFGRHRFCFGKTGASFYQKEVLTSEIPLKLTENFYLPIVLGRQTAQEYETETACYTEEEAKQRAEQELSLFFKKLRIKGLQIIENNVKIEVNGKICTASGTYVTEEESVREQKPEPILQEQEKEETEGNGE